MKKLLLAICGGGALLFGSCKEHDTPINFAKAVSVDTTYVVSPVPSQSSHEVLVEEFTGQSCPNCPGAHADLDGKSAASPNLINVVSMYISGSPQTNPPTGSMHDLRDSIALIISGSSFYGGVGSWPSAGIDRIPASPGTAILQAGSGTWDGLIDRELATTDDSVNLSVSSTYNASNETATIVTMVTYTQAVSTPQNLSVVIVEDSIYDKQEIIGGYDNNYLFMDVFRGMVTSVPQGDVLTVNGGTVKEAGRVIQKVYTYKLPVKTPAINPAHCRIIAFVNSTNGADLHVLQSAHCNLQ